MTAATSASDRYAKARAILARYDAIGSDDDPGYHARVDAAIDALGALRDLISPASTNEGPEEISSRVMRSYTPAFYGPEGEWAFSPTDLSAATIALVQAGIQAAWESWEPENAPGMVPGEPATKETPEGTRRVVIFATLPTENAAVEDVACYLDLKLSDAYGWANNPDVTVYDSLADVLADFRDGVKP